MNFPHGGKHRDNDREERRERGRREATVTLVLRDSGGFRAHTIKGKGRGGEKEGGGDWAVNRLLVPL